MTQLLERTTLEHSTLPESPPIHRETPPTPTPTPVAPEPGRWPRSARWVVAVLAVVALLGALGTIIGFTTGDGGDDGLAAEVEALEGERRQLNDDVATLTDRIDTLETERLDTTAVIAELDDELTATRGELTSAESDLTTARDELAGLRADRDASAEELEAAEAEVASLEAEVTTLETEATLLEAEMTVFENRADALATRVAGLNAQVADLIVRAVSAESDLEALEGLFPIEFDAAILDADLIGDWDVEWDEAYCGDLASCGMVPGVDELRIVETPEGWLRVDMDGYLDAGLFRVDGALHAVNESTTAVPSCNGVARSAFVSLTLYAEGISIADDGTRRIGDLGATLTVLTPATGTCPTGLAFYGANLVPAS